MHQRTLHTVVPKKGQSVTSNFRSVSSVTPGYLGYQLYQLLADCTVDQSGEMVAQHRSVILAHMRCLRLRLNSKKGVLSPLQRTTFLPVVWDSNQHQLNSVGTSVSCLYSVDSLSHKQDPRILLAYCT